MPRITWIKVACLAALFCACTVTPVLHSADAFAQDAATNSTDPPPEDTPTGHDFGDNDPGVYLCMGDSITHGHGIPNYSETYPARLQAMLGQTVINEGQDGARSSYGVRMIGTLLNRYKPGYVLIMFGANDITERSSEEITANLMFMAGQAQVRKTIPIVATVTPVAGRYIGRKSAIIRLNEYLKEHAAARGILVADVATAFNWEDGYLQPDGLHPNSAGMELIAQTFFEKIQESKNNDSGGGGGGGGCTVHPNAGFGFEWLVVCAGIMIMYVRSRIRRSYHQPERSCA